MSKSRPQIFSDFGLAPAELRFVVVDSAWSDRFDAERIRIAAILGSAALDIQHIGSTAILGITAKPILDIGVVICDFNTAHTLDSLLRPLGYTPFFHNADRVLYTCAESGGRTMYHLHLFRRDSWEWERHLRFRDRLLVSPELAAHYSQLKLEAAKQSGGNRDRYQSMKSTFIEEIQNQ